VCLGYARLYSAFDEIHYSVFKNVKYERECLETLYYDVLKLISFRIYDLTFSESPLKLN